MPVEELFYAPVETGPGAHPASYTMGTGSFLRVKRPGRGVDHPPLSNADIKKTVELFLYSPSGPSSPVLGQTLPLPLPLPTRSSKDIFKRSISAFYTQPVVTFWTPYVYHVMCNRAWTLYLMCILCM